VANRIKLESEDAQRLNRLSEEVRGRLTEMASIVARVSGSEFSAGGVQNFVPREGEHRKELAAGDWLELVDIVPGLTCCYGSIGGETILECPCGTATA
jgi:hypothetical protein